MCLNNVLNKYTKITNIIQSVESNCESQRPNGCSPDSSVGVGGATEGQRREKNPQIPLIRKKQ